MLLSVLLYIKFHVILNQSMSLEANESQNTHILIARKALLNGEVIICPTETVYGLAVLEKNRDILDTLKGQNSSKPLTYVFSSIEPVLSIVNDTYTQIAIQRLLPGPFTLLILNNLGSTIGIRVPDHPIWPLLLDKVDELVVMTSANLHKDHAATDFSTAHSIFPHLIGIDCGTTQYARPSKIIDLTGNR